MTSLFTIKTRMTNPSDQRSAHVSYISVRVCAQQSACQHWQLASLASLTVARRAHNFEIIIITTTATIIKYKYVLMRLFLHNVCASPLSPIVVEHQAMSTYLPMRTRGGEASAGYFVWVSCSPMRLRFSARRESVCGRRPMAGVYGAKTNAHLGDDGQHR